MKSHESKIVEHYLKLSVKLFDIQLDIWKELNDTKSIEKYSNIIRKYKVSVDNYLHSYCYLDLGINARMHNKPFYMLAGLYLISNLPIDINDKGLLSIIESFNKIYIDMLEDYNISKEDLFSFIESIV